jgi:hypothetical protein
MILWERPGRHRDLKSKPGFSGHFRARAPIFVQRTTWNRLLRAVLRRRPHLGGTEGRAAARSGARQPWDAADY